MIRGLFPPGVCVATGPSEADARLHPDEAELARAMGPARRREFAAGRACARRALAELGVSSAPVLRGLRRAPSFPDGVVGSITHTTGFCAAAVAHSASYAGIGLDAERDAPLSTRAAERICSPRELDTLRALSGRSVEQWAAVVFSAKESLYKAYFPITGVFIGFRDASILLFPQTQSSGHFQARLARDDAPDAAGQRYFMGRYASDGARVLTGLTIPLEGMALVCPEPDLY